MTDLNRDKIFLLDLCSHTLEKSVSYFHTHSRENSYQFIEKALVPGIHAILEHLLDSLKKAIFPFASAGQVKVHETRKLLWLMMLNENASWATTLDSETMTGMLCLCICIG